MAATASTINLFINWIQGLTTTYGFNQAIMGFTRQIRIFARPFWILLGHYGSAKLLWAELHPPYIIGLHCHK